jgi:hypothetical protein
MSKNNEKIDEFIESYISEDKITEKKMFAIEAALKMPADLSKAEKLVSEAQIIYDFIK